MSPRFEHRDHQFSLIRYHVNLLFLGYIFSVGMVFLPNDDELEAKAIGIVGDVCAQENLEVIGWRDVPVNPSVVGRFATATMPRIKQVLVQTTTGLTGEEFERELFLARKLIENASRATMGDRYQDFYFCTLSSRVIVYKVYTTTINLYPWSSCFSGGIAVDTFFIVGYASICGS